MKAPNLNIKFLFAAGFGWMFLASCPGVIAEETFHGRGNWDLVTLASQVLAGLGVVAWFGSALWWIYDAWASIPVEHRRTAFFNPQTPAVAVVMFFMPCVNLIWVVVSNIGLCESLNRALEARGSLRRVPMPLVAAAVALQLIPYCNVLFGPMLWFAVMFVVEKARSELHSPAVM